ncbi:MAG: DedA family protein [Candidatus Moraniibacteriota bacterium]|nr:MAG: DedA family protein [Candidatus Moranbacteria bacterium]
MFTFLRLWRDAPRFQKFIQSKPVLFSLSLLNWPRKKIRSLYTWVVGWAETKRAEQALATLSFAESSFFPIPPDPLLIAMVMANPSHFLRHAAICTVSSALGGILGYAIGVLLFSSVGLWIVNTYGLQEEFILIGNKYEANAFLTVFTAAFTPIPYKLITIAAGVFKINFLSFVIASLIGRGMRFFLVAFLMHHLGRRYKDSIEKYIDILSLVFVALIILGFMTLKYL